MRDGDDAVVADSRTTGTRPAPANKLSEGERAEILAVANSEEFASLPPSQIVPALADRGVYAASESSFYRVLKTAAQQHYRGRAKKPSGQRHSGQDAVILARREQVYRDARKRNPGRWSQDTRNWTLEDQVWLNPERIRPEILKQAA